MHMHYCGRDIQLQSVITVSEEDEVPNELDRRAVAWETFYVPSTPDGEDLNQAPTEVAPSTPAVVEGETPSVPETPHYQPDQGGVSPEEPALGTATRIDAKERMTQTPPLLSRLIQGYLDHTGIEACPYHQMDHGVGDPDCDHCKRALGPLYHHKIVGNRHSIRALRSLFEDFEGQVQCQNEGCDDSTSDEEQEGEPSPGGDRECHYLLPR